MNSGDLPRLGIVVLAAGFSTRLGAPKALAKVRGLPLLQRTLRVLAPLGAGAAIRVVIPARASRYRIAAGHRVCFITNIRRAAGLASSVVAGLQHTRHCAAVLLLPVDLAQLECREVERLVTRWRGARRQVVAHRIVARPSDAGRGAAPGTARPGSVPGTPLILPRRLIPQAARITGDRGLRDWLRRLPARDVILVDMPSADADVDTPADLARARRRIRPGIGASCARFAPTGSRRRSP